MQTRDCGRTLCRADFPLGPLRLGQRTILFISALGVFALELRRWFDEGVKLSVSIMADAKVFSIGRVDTNTYLSATVTNRGSADNPSRTCCSTTIKTDWLCLSQIGFFGC